MYPRAPFVRLLFPFILGILTAGFWQVHWHHALLLSCVSLILVVLYQLIRSDSEKFLQRQHYGLFMNLALFFTGYCITCADEQYRPDNHISYFVDTTRLIECTIEEKPVEKAKSFRAFASIESLVFDSVSLHSTGGIVIYFQKCKALLSLEAGHKLYCFADLKSPPEALNPGEFDYASYLKKKGVSIQTYIDSTSWTLLDPGIHGRFANRFVRWRDKMLEEMRPYVARGDVFDVLSALILGKTSELDRELMSHYSGAGAIHVLAVSGLHVGLIYLFLLQLLGFIFKERLKILRVFIIAVFLWIYAAISGFSPSVLRSTVMFTAILVGTGINRNSDIFNSLSSSAFLLLGYDPTMVYDIGFQLSYLAVLGIVLFQKGLESLWYIKTGIFYKIWQLTCVSLAAQVITYPIGLYYFGQFPNYFLIANMIVIPLSTGILYVAILFFAVFWIPWLAKPVGKLLSIATEWLNAIVTVTDQLPGSKTEDISLNLPWALFLMGVSCWIMLIWQRRWWNHLRYLLFVLSASFFVSASTQIDRAFDESVLCFHSLKEGIGITYVHGESAYYFHEGDSLADKSIVDRKLRTYWRSLNRGEVKFVNLKDSSICSPEVYMKSNDELSLPDVVINFQPRKTIETHEVPEIVLMNTSHFIKDSVLIRSILSDCDILLVGADVKEYKWKKMQAFLSELEKAKVYYLGYGALIFGDKKVKQQKGAP